MERRALHVYNNYLKLLVRQMGAQMTYGSHLIPYARKLLGTKFKGVYASDAIPVLNQRQPYCIANVDKSNAPGSHWVAMAYRNGNVYVYDSFGRKTKKLIPHAFKQNMIDTEYDAEQRVSQDDCGQRCIAWLAVFDLLGPAYALTI